MSHATDLESLLSEPAQRGDDDLSCTVAGATRIRRYSASPGDFVVPVVRGGSRWLGNDLSREPRQPQAVRWTGCQRARCVKRWLDYTRDMKIGAAARASGLTIKAIRHYESACLLRNVRRSGAYRDFSDRDVDTLRLAAHCRGLGFSLAETKDVLALVTASEPDCPPPDQMNAIVENRLRTVRGEIRELERKARELEKVRTYVQKRLAGA